ncbi:unnamed protein product [Paramecium sonneborni]|uniref:Transmembrane protein n=1 Tax=Paramecium sonneborni TaxID=65129 RepID=A0A8S1K9L1_9CILI|nr:unnamed protein product [Paramecium sonneborni]
MNSAFYNNQINDSTENHHHSVLEVLKQKGRNKMKILKRRLFFILIVEILGMSVQILALSLKNWYLFQLEEDEEIWIQLIYIQRYIGYSQFCEKMNVTNNLLCKDLKLVGLICFCIIMFAIFVQILEVFRLIIYLKKGSPRILWKLKGKLLQVVFILLLLCGYAGYLLTILFLFQYNQQIKYFGFSYWMGAGSILAQILISFYYRITKGSLRRNNSVHKYLLYDNVKLECSNTTK